jgi:hypothetical protein
MGTSHRHTPTVLGEPNWGNASAAVTSIAGAEEKLDEIEKELEGMGNPEDSDDNQENEERQTKTANASPPPHIVKKQRQLDGQIRRNYHKAVSYLVKAAGGRSKVSSGASRAIGHAGISIANGLVSVINEIVNNGLSDWLSRRGITSLEGKSCQDVLDLIKNYIEAGVAGLDNTAANEALECVLDDLEAKVGDDLQSLEDVLTALMATDDVKNLLDKFFGMYVFSHLSQDFKEKLEYTKGTKVTNETMNEIKDLIMDDVQRSYGGRDASTIDWGTEDGKTFIQAEFDRILYILSGDED